MANLSNNSTDVDRAPCGMNPTEKQHRRKSLWRMALAPCSTNYTRCCCASARCVTRAT